MPILPKQPIIVPQKEYTELYIKRIFIESTPNGKTEATIVLYPYDPVSGEINSLDSLQKTLNISDVTLASSQIPEVGMAFQAIVGAVAKIVQSVE